MVSYLLIANFVSAPSHAQVPPDAYRVETVATPKGIEPEISSITFGPDGRLYACFRRGYIYSMDLATGRWRKFASGLHTPMGIVPGGPGEFFVAQVPELTRVADTDGDGKADLFETVSDGWGLSGNYHEFIAGPVRDREGNFYISLGLASSGANPRPPVRGEFTTKGRQSEEPEEGKVNRVGHYSPVPYRGCAVKITPAGQLSLFACGFRQPNGLCMSPEGEIFVADNQGDWVGTSPLHHVTEGAFHGHPSSLNWHPAFRGRDPVEIPIAELAGKRKLPAILFPQNDMGGSVAEPLYDLTGGKFGPFAGQMFVAEWTYPRVHRVDLEKVGGEYQGATFPFVYGNGLRKSNNRMAFSPDGRSLYIAQTSRIWGSTEGLQKITFTGRVPMDIRTMRLGKSGFDLTFTKPLDPATASDPTAYSMTHYYYRYHAEYGSPKTNVTPVKVTGVSVSEDGLGVSLTLESLVPGRVYDLRPQGIRSADGEPLATTMAAYTLNRLPP
jgi:glucose/arabinose dehydrogenase